MSTRRIDQLIQNPERLCAPGFSRGYPRRKEKLVFVASRPKLSVIANQSADWCGNPPVEWNQVTITAKKRDASYFSGCFSVRFPSNRGIATTSVRTGLAMTGNWATARQTPIRQPAGETRQAYSLVSGWTPVTEKMTHSAMLVAWSPMRSKYLATISRSRAYSPSPGFLAIKSRMSHLIWLK